MFPIFQNDPNGLAALIYDAADFPVDLGVIDQTDTTGYEIVSGYDADGVVDTANFSIAAVEDGTTGIFSLILNYVGALTGVLTVKLNTPDLKDYNANSADENEFELAPVSGVPDETVTPSVPVNGNLDASAVENVPSDLMPQANKSWN